MNKRTQEYRQYMADRIATEEIDLGANVDNEFYKMIVGNTYTAQGIRSVQSKSIPDHLFNTKQQDAVTDKENS